MSYSNTRPIALTAAIALLVLTAGCAGSLSGGDGYDVEGSELDGQTLTNQTATAVENSGSYTLNSTQEVTREQQGTTVTTAVNRTVRINFESDTGIQSGERTRSNGDSTQSLSTAIYTDGNTSYARQESGNDVSYDVQEGGTNSVDTTEFAQNYTGFVDDFGWERNGTETVDGVTVTRYTTIQNGTSDNIGNPSGQLLVDSDGVIREVTLSFALTNFTPSAQVELSIVLSDVGSTTVAEPAWVEDARAQS